MGATKWSMKGTLLGACSCDWGCPCSFDAPPTRGFCQGGYLWHVEKGNFGAVSLDGASFTFLGHSPAALHKGNVTWLAAVDERTSPEQRKALEILFEGKSGGPWVVFMAVAGKYLGTRFVPFDLQLDGLNSKARAVGVAEYEMGPILNPVTGVAEELHLDKPTGFTSKRITLGNAKLFRVSTPELSYEHRERYAEFSHFDYAGETPA